MQKTATVTARIEPILKENVEQIFSQLGLTTTQAITLFLRQVELQQGLPFLVKIPNETTIAALREAQDPQKLTRYSDVNELLADLGIE